MKNAPEEEFRLVRKPSNPATASEPLNPATAICSVSVTDEPGLATLLLVGEKLRPTVPTVANAIVGSANAATRANANFCMLVFILGCLSVLCFSAFVLWFCCWLVRGEILVIAGPGGR